MSDPASSHSNPLDSLAPGVVLMGRYSLKDRVPRWIAERRFKARDLETGDIVAILAWSDPVAWMEEFIQKAEALPTRPFREIKRVSGLCLIITDWVRGMRELTGEGETAEVVLEQLQKSLPSTRVALPPRRSVALASPVELRQRTRVVVSPAVSSAVPTTTWRDTVALGMGLAVALLVGGFTWQMIQSLREPLVIAPKPEVPFFQSGSSLGKVTLQLTDAQALRKNGNTTSALGGLLDLQERTPDDARIQVELNSLLASLQNDLENLRSGMRPALVRAIGRAAEAGNAEAKRLQAALTRVPENAAASEPLPIR